MRSLGRFVGSLGSNFRAGVRGEERQEIRRETEERTGVDEQGRTVILRRTTVDEVEVREDGGRS